jgi:hypothetical protein
MIQKGFRTTIFSMLGLPIKPFLLNSLFKLRC